METTTPATPSSVAIKWTIFSVLTSIIVTYAFQFAHISQTNPLKYVALLPYIVFLVLAQKEYRERIGGFMTYGQGFQTGFLFALYNALIMTVFMFLYYKFLSPAAYDEVLQTMRDGMAAKNVPAEQAEVAMNVYNKYGVFIFTFFTLIGGIVTGTIISLITAAIFKKERTLIDIERENNYTDPGQ